MEIEAIAKLVQGGMIIIACGGGGIPVTAEKGKLKPIDAVMQKMRYFLVGRTLFHLCQFLTVYLVMPKCLAVNEMF